MASRTPAVAALVCLATLSGSGQAAPVAAPSPPCTNTYGPGLHEIELGFRRFLLAVPDGLPAGGGRRVPAVLDWHGYSESPWYQNLLVGLEGKLEEYRWIGVLPFGTAPLPTTTCCPLAGCDEECCRNGEELDRGNACSFNGGGCCGAASNRNVNEVEFARDIIDWLHDNMCADRENVFATGFSNGGIVSNRLGCEASFLFKGIAPVSGNIRFGGEFTACQPQRPVSWLSVCGSEDSVCNEDFDDTASLWSRVNGCVGQPTPTFISATTRCEAWFNCDGDDTFVEKCLVADLEHEWSGRQRPDGTSPKQNPANIDATDYMFARWSTLVASTQH